MYLFDASSIVKAIKYRKLSIIAGNYIQCLTIYEVLNAIWKEYRLLSKQTFISLDYVMELIDILRKLLKYVNIVNIHDLENEVMKISLETNLTIYDASYIAVALREKLILVTEDNELLSKARKYVEARSLEEIIEK